MRMNKTLLMLLSLVAMRIVAPAPTHGALREGRWLLTAELPDGKYRLPVDISDGPNRALTAVALGKGATFAIASLRDNQLTLRGQSVFGPIEIMTTVEAGKMAGKWRAGLVGGKIVGEYQDINSSPASRKQTFEEVCATINREFYDPAFIAADWKGLQAKYRLQAKNLPSDGQLYQLVQKMLREIKTSHLSFNLLRPGDAYTSNSLKPEAGDKPGGEKAIRWRRLAPGIGYLKITSFKEGPAFVQLIDKAFADLGDLPALVIDLRENGGGTLSAAMRLGDYLLDKFQPVGCFATRAGLDGRGLKSMDQLDITRLPQYAGYDLHGFMRALRKSGAVAVFSGGRAKTFHGKIVVLINRQCASTAEAFAGVLKELQVATLIGPRRRPAPCSRPKTSI